MNGNHRSAIRSIRGPITLITVGVLFALNNFTEYGFNKTWPVILIVFGLLSLWRRTAEPELPPYAPPAYSAAPPANTPPPAEGPYDPVTGAYRGPQAGPYNPPPATARGGFGTTAPPRSTGETAPETSPPTTGGSV